MNTYTYSVNGNKFIVVDHPEWKTVRSANYNYDFCKKTGMFKRWGKTVDDDPQFSPIGPEILDIEISVNGCPNNCRFCYKGNSNTPATNMTLETFKRILDMHPKTLTQIAFGITGTQTNPDFIKMMEYCREVGVIPNFTLSGIDLTDDFAIQSSKLIGAVAVSAYQTDKNVCYDTVKQYTDLGIKQTNIHLLVSKENINFVYEVLNDRLTDPRLADMRAIVFLGVKPKGRAKDRFSPLPYDDFQRLIEFAFSKNLIVGFDSCSAPKFEKSVLSSNMNDELKQRLIQCSESCESSLFSSYINVNGEYWNCSFSENEDGITCVDVLQAQDYMKDVWYAKPIRDFRNKVISSSCNGCRKCVVFNEINI